MPPGDHLLTVDTRQPSDHPYTLGLERLDPLALPVDLEPANNQAEGGQTIPPDLVLTGENGSRADSEDWYRLPRLEQPVDTTITSQGEVRNLDFYVDGQRWTDTSFDRNTGILNAMLPDNKQLDLRVRADGVYTLEFAFEPDVDLGPVPGDLPVTLDLTVSADMIAGFWHEAQIIDLALTLTNQGDSPEELALDVASSDYVWTPSLAEESVTLDAGETKTVPLRVAVLANARTDAPVQLTVRARNQNGAQTTASVDLLALCGAEPVNPNQLWTTAGDLFGGLNVAWTALGAAPVPEDDRQLELLDHVVSPSKGWRGAPGDAVTVDLAGDEAVPVTGVLINPQGRTDLDQQVREFELLLSDDGTTFTTVMTGTLAQLPMEQSFPLAVPVQARYAQLRPLSSHEGGNVVGVGAFKVLAEPESVSIGREPSGRGFNIA
ncbi:hypothetical protein LCGC14_2577260, partial [marine sediment metagenome]